MEQFNFVYQIPLQEINFKTIIVADQKDYIEKECELRIKGKVLVDIVYENKTQHEEKELDFTLSKNQYPLKNIAFNLKDYDYKIEEQILYLTVYYELIGEDVSLERFCSLESDDIEYKLRDYLHRNGEEHQLQIPEDSIVLLDPVIEEPPLEVKIEKESKVEEKIVEKEKIEVKKEEKPIEKNNSLLKETYACSGLYYRLKKNDTIEELSKRYQISSEEIKRANPRKEWKENSLILIPRHV